MDSLLMDACYKMQLCFPELQWCGSIGTLLSSCNEFIFFFRFSSTLPEHSRLPPIIGNGAATPLLDSNLLSLSAPSPLQSISITLKIPSSHSIFSISPKRFSHFLWAFSLLWASSTPLPVDSTNMERPLTNPERANNHSRQSSMIRTLSFLT